MTEEGETALEEFGAWLQFLDAIGNVFSPIKPQIMQHITLLTFYTNISIWMINCGGPAL